MRELGVANLADAAIFSYRHLFRARIRDAEGGLRAFLFGQTKALNGGSVILANGIFPTQSGILKNFSQKISIVTLREAKRGSAGVPVAKCEAAGDTQSVQEMTM